MEDSSNPGFFGYLLVIVLLSAPLIALVARNWVLHIEPVTWRGTDVATATNLVAIYTQSVHDHRFAYPTGVFLIDGERTGRGYVTAWEANFKRGFHFDVFWLMFYPVFLVDMGLRWIMRSRIDAFIEPHGALDDAVTVRFELRGLSAFGVEHALRQGISTPALPARYRAAAGADELAEVVASPAGVSRLGLVYGLVGGIAVGGAAAISLL